MIVASRLSAVWQVASVAVAALGCYLVSQSVASERANLIRVDRQIAAAQDDIARLQTEIGVRARMVQLEAWNTTFGLHAPRPGQYAADGVQLAALVKGVGQPALPLNPAVVPNPGGPIRVAYKPDTAAPMPAQHAPEQQPMLRAASYVRPVADRLGPAHGGEPVLEKAAFVPDLPSTPPATDDAAPARHAKASLLPADVAGLAAAEAGAAKDRTKGRR